MSEEAVLKIADKELILPVITGTENEKAVDMRTLRSQTGYITFDEGFGNTGSCQSEITFINGEKGILRYSLFLSQNRTLKLLQREAEQALAATRSTSSLRSPTSSTPLT